MDKRQKTSLERMKENYSNKMIHRKSFYEFIQEKTGTKQGTLGYESYLLEMAYKANSKYFANNDFLGIATNCHLAEAALWSSYREETLKERANTNKLTQNDIAYLLKKAYK